MCSPTTGSVASMTGRLLIRQHHGAPQVGGCGRGSGGSAAGAAAGAFPSALRRPGADTRFAASVDHLRPPQVADRHAEHVHELRERPQRELDGDAQRVDRCRTRSRRTRRPAGSRGARTPVWCNVRRSADTAVGCRNRRVRSSAFVTSPSRCGVPLPARVVVGVRHGSPSLPTRCGLRGAGPARCTPQRPARPRRAAAGRSRSCRSRRRSHPSPAGERNHRGHRQLRRCR